jgi:hypothetical protein
MGHLLDQLDDLNEGRLAIGWGSLPRDVNAATSCCHSPKEFRCQADERGRAATHLSDCAVDNARAFLPDHPIAGLELRGSLELPIDFGEGRSARPIGWLWPLE